MQLIVKTKGSQPVVERDRKWSEAKFAKLGKLFAPATVVEVMLEHLQHTKSSSPDRVTVVAEIPHATEPFHLVEEANGIRKAVSTARDRLARHAIRQREKYIDRTREPRLSLLERVRSWTARKSKNTSGSQEV